MQHILSKMRKAIEDYNMIDEGDKIAVCLSGGKDSITMLNGLKALQRFPPSSLLLSVRIDHLSDFLDLFLTQFLSCRKCCEKCRERSLKRILHKLLALCGGKLRFRHECCNSSLLILKNATLTQTF